MALPLASAVENGLVLILVTLVVLPIAAVAFIRSAPAWRGIGKGRFAIEREPAPRPGAPPPPPHVVRAEQTAELRQMLEAKSYRREQRGEPGLDVEAELGRLLDDGPEPPPGAARSGSSQGAGGEAPGGVDAELREEVRQLVIARNDRRARNGQPPLDVEAEIERQLADL